MPHSSFANKNLPLLGALACFSFTTACDRSEDHSREAFNNASLAMNALNRYATEAPIDPAWQPGPLEHYSRRMDDAVTLITGQRYQSNHSLYTAPKDILDPELLLADALKTSWEHHGNMMDAWSTQPDQAAASADSMRAASIEALNIIAGPLRTRRSAL